MLKSTSRSGGNGGQQRPGLSKKMVSTCFYVGAETQRLPKKGRLSLYGNHAVALYSAGIHRPGTALEHKVTR